jgi:hypothetical protein
MIAEIEYDQALDGIDPVLAEVEKKSLNSVA